MLDPSNVVLYIFCLVVGGALGVAFDSYYAIILSRAFLRLISSLENADAGVRHRVLKIVFWAGLVVPLCCAYVILQSARLFGTYTMLIGAGVGLGVALPWVLVVSRVFGPSARRPIPQAANFREPRTQPGPPVAAQYLLELLAPAEWSEAALGDFFELYGRRFQRVEHRHGLFLAKVHYWTMVVRSAPGLLRIRSRHLAALVGIMKVLDVLQKYWVAR